MQILDHPEKNVSGKHSCLFCTAFRDEGKNVLQN
jgi:hypothetical protein